MIHTGRRALPSLEGSYHGNSLAVLSIGASDSRERKNLLLHCGKITPPLDATALRRIEAQLKAARPRRVRLEPISINLGVQIPDHDVIQRVRDIRRRYGTLFIADEVASGFGRTGRLFACEHFDLEPDMLCVAKAMTGGLAPIGAVIATAPVAQSMEENGAHDTCRSNGLLVSTEGSTVMVLPSLAIDKQTCERAGHSGALDMMRGGGVAANPSARRRECARVSIPRAGLAPARPVQPADLPLTVGISPITKLPRPMRCG